MKLEIHLTTVTVHISLRIDDIVIYISLHYIVLCLKGAELYEQLKKACPQVAHFNELCGGNGKSMCHGDARTENCLWPNQRKDPLVLIDWQFVSYSSPLSDVCYFIGVCLNPDEQDKYAETLIRHYYDTLTTSPGGSSTTEYPWDTFMLDYKRCMWVSMWVSCMVRDGSFGLKVHTPPPPHSLCTLPSVHVFGGVLYFHPRYAEQTVRNSNMTRVILQIKRVLQTWSASKRWQCRTRGRQKAKASRRFGTTWSRF